MSTMQAMAEAKQETIQHLEQMEKQLTVIKQMRDLLYCQDRWCRHAAARSVEWIAPHGSCNGYWSFPGIHPCAVKAIQWCLIGAATKFGMSATELAQLLGFEQPYHVGEFNDTHTFDDVWNMLYLTQNKLENLIHAESTRASMVS